MIICSGLKSVLEVSSEEDFVGIRQSAETGKCSFATGERASALRAAGFTVIDEITVRYLRYLFILGGVDPT